MKTLLQIPKLSTTLRIALILAALVAFSWHLYLWNLYFDKLPRSPDKFAGRTYADNFHGIAVYETRGERFRLHAADYSADLLVLAAILTEAGRQWIKRTPKLRLI